MNNQEMSVVLPEDLVFEQLEERLVPDVGCVTSSSCNCSSSSCVIYGS